MVICALAYRGRKHKFIGRNKLVQKQTRCVFRHVHVKKPALRNDSEVCTDVDRVDAPLKSGYPAFDNN